MPSRVWPPSLRTGCRVGSCTRRRSALTAARVHPVSPWVAAGLLCVSFRATSPKLREVARDPRYALHTAQPLDDHAGAFGEFMARGLLERIAASHLAVTARPGQTPYGLVHYTCSIEEAVATEYSDDEMPVYRRWKP